MKAAWWRLVKFGFRLLYHELAFTYDTVAELVSLGQWWEWQRTALKFLPPPEAGMILELAYGTGHFQLDLQAGGWQAVGCDFSRQMSRLARRRVQKAGGTVRLVRGRAQQLPFPSGAFAAVVSTFPTPFILESATLNEIKRVLRRDGVIVIVVSGVLTQRGTAERLLEEAYRVTGQRGTWGIDVKAHCAAHGFALAQHTVPLERSLVTVLTAKPQT